jgi:hypothetical protein
MQTWPKDTDPKIEQVWISLLRKASTSKKLAQVCSLTHTVLSLSRRAIERRNPGLSDREIDLLFVRYHYGAELAERLREYLERKSL